jgi:hypothetical protein
VEQDLNTLLEESASRSYGAAEITAFYADAFAEFDVILEQYYPTRDVE